MAGARPEELRFSPYGEESRDAGPRRPWRVGRGAAGVSRMPAAHPEGYIEAFANLYRDAADDHPAPTAAAARSTRRGRRWCPTSRTARAACKFVAAAVGSNEAGGGWTAARV